MASPKPSCAAYRPASCRSYDLDAAEREGSKFIAITYAIALGEFAHVVAGSAEIFLLLITGEIAPALAFGGLLLPILIGNVLGGTALFSLIAYGQVRHEM